MAGVIYVSVRLKAKGGQDETGWRLPADEIESLVIRQTCLRCKFERNLLTETQSRKCSVKQEIGRLLATHKQVYWR